ncbi:MAG TPA: hypothetical protein VN943_02545 [Candidatus Acidoferrum sp.]|nr:hypothetical protein [Candidatus Acidoferrum sp.]
MSGTDAGLNFGAFIARVGSFTADGNGSITAAIEDVTDAGSLPQLVQFSGGSYSIQGNGNGTLTLGSSTGGALQLSIALNSANAGVMIQTDLNVTASGSFTLQSPAAFTQTAIAGPYAFDISGTTSTGGPSSTVGQITTNGSGNIQGGSYDANDSGKLFSAQVIPAGGTYQMDPANGANFGRGTIRFAGLSFIFYIVDASRFKLMEDDGLFATFGDALHQSATVALQNSGFKGDFTFLIGGSAVLGTAGPVARAAAFTADGSGNVGAIALDDNDTGTHGAITGSTTITNAIYDIDTVNAGSGRGTMSFTASANPNLGTFFFVFYLISPTEAFIQDTSNGIVGDGTMFAQTGTFSGPALAGNFVFDWSGINLGSTANLVFEEDFVGQHALSSAGAISGVVDFVELGSSTRNPAFLNQALTGSLTLNGNGTGSNDYTVTTGTAPQTTFHFKAYIANPDLILLVGADDTRTIAGSVSFQP